MKFSKFSKRALSLALVVVLVLSFTISARAAAPGTNSITTVNLMAAASMRYSLGERQTNGAYPSGTLLDAFEDQYDITVNVTYDSSGNLLNAMIADTTRSADVFISADLARMNSAVAADIIDGDTVYNLLNNELVLVANQSTGLAPNSLPYSGVAAWLAGASGRTIAIGDPTVVPAGSYTRLVFDAIDPTGATWNNILAKATLYSNVTNVLNAVAGNVNPIGSVYATDAATNGSLIVLAHEDVDIIYPIGITTAAMEDEEVRGSAAQELVDFLKADIAKPTGSVFKAFGFSAAA
ncbi:molybdate transport system substrate-binding protein [Sporobacter termitidis DSM 10068]|uniref:Molybdate transport system substrate-binding protein n=1 Tax=Sporobacter termitidis DSM 10068 TaxID=1123282 RepID=A0A1M5UQR8_9FIRM|nr:molybdate ABC transporter substrate-binding protein [Sporobacter termitidis]SHH65319.1 molybdate transport system substrate-binding protein [Sporobacter termitidis DSM 10068]